jgi:hypothetical protein
LERRSAEITRLKETIKELQPREKVDVDRPPKKPAKSAPPKITETNSALDETQIQILRKIAESEEGLAERGLISSSGNDRVLAEYNLGELQARGYASRNYDNVHRDYILTVTHPCRTYLVKHARGGDKSPTPA